MLHSLKNVDSVTNNIYNYFTILDTHCYNSFTVNISDQLYNTLRRELRSKIDCLRITDYRIDDCLHLHCKNAKNSKTTSQ